MLIEFTVGNHLSFKDRKTLSLEAASIKEFEENTFKAGNYTLLKSVAIYGANSSGKSNFLESFRTMQKIVRSSTKMSSVDRIDVKPFLLNQESEKAPSYFEILILVENTRYRYGFEADENEIHSEWLFEKRSATKESLLFIRDHDKIESSKKFSEGKGIEERTRENALFLSAVDQWNGAISKKIVSWITAQIFFFSGLDHDFRTKQLLEFDQLFDYYVRDLIPYLNLGFADYKIKSKGENDDFYAILTKHNKYNIDGKIIGEKWFDLDTQESSGTKKMMDFASVLMGALMQGCAIVIDELDAKLHPLLTLSIVNLFNSSIYNPRNAQLIFATHDTNLLTYGNFRRDQIYFTEKNHFEETDLYSLVEYKDTNGVKPRNDSSFEKDYIKGRYGAIPFIGNFSNLVTNGAGI